MGLQQSSLVRLKEFHSCPGCSWLWVVFWVLYLYRVVVVCIPPAAVCKLRLQLEQFAVGEFGVSGLSVG